MPRHRSRWHPPVADIDFAGQSFAMADKIGLMPLMRFAKAAKDGADSDSLDGILAMYALLEQCVAPDDWDRFQDAADKARSDGEELMAVVGFVIGELSARPTSRPSDSSDGPTTTQPKSGDASYLRVVERLEAEGRPGLALAVELANEARSA